MSGDQEAAGGGGEWDARLSFTVATVWRAERVSCPHPHVLQSYLQGELAAGAREFVAFHLQDSECPYCNATLEDLRAREDDAQGPSMADLRDRLLRSTVAALGRGRR